jgi:hypothetical protein
MSGIFGIDLLYNHKKKKYFNSAIKIDKNNSKLSNDIIKNKSNNIFIEKKNKNNHKNNDKNNNSELKSLNKLNDILGLNEPDDNKVLLKLLKDRLNLGRERYGHGVRIDDDIGQYGPQGGNNWELMAEEELLDGMIYLGANLIRRRRERRLKYNTRKSNDDIIINTRTGELWNDIKRSNWF